MTGPSDVSRVVVSAARGLPDGDVRRVAVALSHSLSALQRERALSSSPAVRHLCNTLMEEVDGGAQPGFLAGYLLGGVAAAGRACTVDVVWSGPTSPADSGRLTSGAVVDLIGSARREVLLVGYAVQDEPRVVQALRSATERGVEVLLLLERSIDNAQYKSAGGLPFPDVPARRLAWPGARRPAGASLHAKLLVADGERALVGSANITAAALNRNIECGVLLSGRREAGALKAHVLGLLSQGDLVDVSAGS